MGYDNRFTGAITITPPLTRPQIHEVQNGKLARLTDVKLRIVKAEVESEDGETVTIRKTADAIVPLDMTYSGHHVAEDVQALIDHFTGHEFAGHIQVQWDPGFEDPIPTRYVVRDRRVVEVRPTLVWPDDATPTTDQQPAERT